MTEMKKKKEPAEWCLVGNIRENLVRRDGSREEKFGTKHFSPKTLVYCASAKWGDGYEQIIVIGRHRKSGRFINCVIDWRYITNWRAKLVYHPEVFRRLNDPKAFDRLGMQFIVPHVLSWGSLKSAKAEIDRYVKWMIEREVEYFQKIET
jgi:hypothetical protein